MCEPLSITTGVLSILNVCATVGWELKKFHDSVKSVDETVDGLAQDVSSLTHVLESMKETLSHIETLDSASHTGYIGEHWRNLAQALDGGNASLIKLGQVLEKVNKEVQILDGTRKAIRLKSATSIISTYRSRIQGSRDVLSLSIQTILLYNQVKLQESTQKILPNLEHLSTEIRRIANYLNPYIQALELTTTDVAQEEELDYARNLRECVRSSASIVSSASTVLYDEAGERASVVADSDFGDCFPKEYSEPMQRWIATNKINEEPDIDNSSTSGLPVERDGSDESDADVELETEMTNALLDAGRNKYLMKDFSDAESLLKSCDARLIQASTSANPSSRKRAITFRFTVLDILLEVYRDQLKVTEMQDVLSAKIALRQGLHSDKFSVEMANDILALAKILVERGAVSEAHLQARRALRSFKKLGTGGQAGVREALDLLIRICEIESNKDDLEAYKAYRLLLGPSDQMAIRSLNIPTPLLAIATRPGSDPALVLLKHADSQLPAINNALQVTESLPKEDTNSTDVSAARLDQNENTDIEHEEVGLRWKPVSTNVDREVQWKSTIQLSTTNSSTSSATNDSKPPIEERDGENLATGHDGVPGSSISQCIGSWIVDVEAPQQTVKQIRRIAISTNASTITPSSSDSPTEVVMEPPKDTPSEQEASSYSTITQPKNENLAPSEHNEPQPFPGSISSSHNHMARIPNKKDLRPWWRHFSNKGNQVRDKEKRDRVFTLTRPNTLRTKDIEENDMGVFGVPIEISLRYAKVSVGLEGSDEKTLSWLYIPIVVVKCSDFLREKASLVAGVFRRNGSERRIIELRTAFDSPPRYGKGLDLSGYSEHDVANLLCRYLNQLPEPVVPLTFYENFREPLRGYQWPTVDGPYRFPQGGAFDIRAFIQLYQRLILQLPPVRRHILLYILELLAVFASEAQSNQMRSGDLAAVFQRGILSHPQHDFALWENRLNQNVVMFLIIYQSSFALRALNTTRGVQTLQDIGRDYECMT